MPAFAVIRTGVEAEGEASVEGPPRRQIGEAVRIKPMDGPRTGASAVPDKTHGRACFDLDQTAIPAKLIILKRRWGMLAMPDAPVVPAIRGFQKGSGHGCCPQ
jgi:hypothetical protein